MADHLGALLHVLLKVLLVRIQERRHGRLQDAGEHLDLMAKTTSHSDTKQMFLLLCNWPVLAIDLITTRRGSYRQAACDIAAVVLDVDLRRVNQSR